MLKLLLPVVVFAVMLFCLVDAISTPPERTRHLPKVAWVLLVLFFPLVGSLAWLVAGRPESGARGRSSSDRGQAAFPEYDRPGRFAATDPAKDEEFLRKVRERAEEQRRRHEQTRRKPPEEGAGAEDTP